MTRKARLKWIDAHFEKLKKALKLSGKKIVKLTDAEIFLIYFQGVADGSGLHEMTNKERETEDFEEYLTNLKKKG